MHQERNEWWTPSSKKVGQRLVEKIEQTTSKGSFLNKKGVVISPEYEGGN